MTLLSYTHGASPVPLLGDTIGENLRRTVERFGDCEALVVAHQGYRATYRELWGQVGLAELYHVGARVCDVPSHLGSHTIASKFSTLFRGVTATPSVRSRAICRRPRPSERL